MASLALNRTAAISASKKFALSSVRRELSSLRSVVEEYPNLPSTTPTQAKVGETKITKLESGLTIVTEDGASTSTVSLSFPNGGASSEASDESGASFSNKMFAFKSAGGMSSVSILRAVQNGGGSPFTSSNRYCAKVGYTCAPENASGLLGAVLTSTASSFEKWDVREATTLAKAEAAIANAKPEMVLNEAIYASSYGAQSAMGRPYYASCSDKALMSFRESNYILNGAVLTATGVVHEDFTAEAVDVLSELEVSSGKSKPAAEAVFLGSETRISMPHGGAAHVALSMKSPTASPALLSVLKHCYTISGASAYASYSVVGVFGSSAPEGAGALTDSLSTVLANSFPADVVNRAKALAKGEAMQAAEGCSTELAELMSTWVLHSGSFDARSVAAAYDGITEKDVNEAVSQMKETGVSLAAVGEIAGVPYLGCISN